LLDFLNPLRNDEIILSEPRKFADLLLFSGNETVEECHPFPCRGEQGRIADEEKNNHPAAAQHPSLPWREAL